MASDLTVVVATHRRRELLRRTLNSLAQCEKPDAYRGTVVVENGTRAGSEAVARECPDTLNVKYLYVPRANKSHALNEAIRTIEGGLVVFFDDDVRLNPQVLMSYAKASEGVEAGAMYGGPFGVDYETEPPAWLKPYLPDSALGKSATDEWKLDRDAFNGFLGFNWAAFAYDIKSHGGFDDRYGPGSGTLGQETDMQERLLHAGVRARMLPPEAMVWHYVPEERCSPKWVLERRVRSGRRKSRIEMSVPGGRLRWGRAATVLLDHAARAAKWKALTTVWRAAKHPKQHFDQSYNLCYHVGAIREVVYQIAQRLKA